MSLLLNFQYRFHAAGQGIFASGSLRKENGAGKFDWVFDCGSFAPKAVLKPAIKQYKADHLKSTQLDLLCISHFDYDHVSGLPELLKGMSVDTIVMPYYSPFERLLIGILGYDENAGELDPDWVNFLVDPVAHLEKYATQINKIVFISPDRVREYDDKVRKTEYLETEDKFLSWKDPINKIGNFEGIKIESTPSTQAKIDKLEWEFLFFHKPIDPKKMEVLERKLNSSPDLQNTLKDSQKIEEIKKWYIDILGKGQMNATSLCVYSGPIYTPPSFYHISPVMELLDSAYSKYTYSCCNVCSTIYYRVSVLYTGDANFKPDRNRHELIKFLEDSRWQKILILQVPHHGSKKNWKSGSSIEFYHRYSVFCADKNHKNEHPDQEVLDDLIGRAPLIADNIKEYHWFGYIMRLT